MIHKASTPVHTSIYNVFFFFSQALFYESLDYFVLVGIVCGLAIYNSVIIDLPFPTALYKKLLQRLVMY